MSSIESTGSDGTPPLDVNKGDYLAVYLLEQLQRLELFSSFNGLNPSTLLRKGSAQRLNGLNDLNVLRQLNG